MNTKNIFSAEKVKKMFTTTNGVKEFENVTQHFVEAPSSLADFGFSILTLSNASVDL